MSNPSGPNGNLNHQSEEDLSSEKDHASLLNVNKEPDTKEDTNLKKTITSTDPDEFEPPEGGWGWVVCFASFWTNGTIFGILNLFGVLFVSIIDEFKVPGGDDIAFKACKLFVAFLFISKGVLRH